MSDLLVKPIPYKTESPIGFLLRLVELNGWTSINSFLSSNEQLYKTPYIDRLVSNQEKWDKIMNSMGIAKESRVLCYSYDENDKESRMPIFGFFGIQVKIVDIRTINPMICPECLSENAYCKKQWDHKSISICTTHHSYLVDRCSKCEKQISWNRSRLRFCNCGFDLTKIDTKPVSVKYSLFINQIFLGTGHLQLLEFKNTSQAIKNFCKFVGKKCDIDKVFEITHAFLYDKHVAYSFIREGIRYALKSKGIHPRLSLMSFYKLSSTQLNGFFKGVFEAKEILNFNVDSNPQNIQLNMDQVRFVLGIPYKLIRQLLSEGILASSQKSKNSRIYVDSNSLNTFLLKLSNPKKKPRFKVPLNKINNHPLEGSVIESIKAIIIDDVQYNSMKLEGGVFSVEVDLKSIYIGSRTLSIPEVRKICNICYRNVEYAISSGMIKIIDPSLTNDKFKYYMTRKEVNKFNNRYIFERAIAREYCGNIYQVALRLEILGVKPISEPNNSVHSNRVYRRADLEKINIDDVRLMKNSTIKLLS